jgi:Putative Actinobacterial Holin-X, holin superfamily III
MPTPEPDRNRGGLGSAVKDVTEHASTWFRLERELAIIELKNKITSLGLGLGLAIGAALVAVYALGFLFATIAAGLATFMPTWLALLVVTLFLLVTAGILGALGFSRIKRGTPPVPEQAIREAKLTQSALKGDGR